MVNPLKDYDLTDRVAVVTGAASGIGAATAEYLAGAGAAVVCSDIDAEGLKGTVQRIVDDGGWAVAQLTDVTSRSEVDALVARAVEEKGRLDVMCNVAGAMTPGAIEELTDAVIERGLDLNLRSVIYGCQAAVAVMKGQGRGSIINVSSGIVDNPYPGMGLYAMAKASVAILSMTLAKEVGQYGIRVNATAPGATITNFTTWRMKRADGTIDQEAFDTFVEAMRVSSPLGTTGDANDQAALILYLASDASRWVTGNIHRVNGGSATPW